MRKIDRLNIVRRETNISAKRHLFWPKNRLVENGSFRADKWKEVGKENVKAMEKSSMIQNPRVWFYFWLMRGPLKPYMQIANRPKSTCHLTDTGLRICVDLQPKYVKGICLDLTDLEYTFPNHLRRRRKWFDSADGIFINFKSTSN